MGWAARWWNMLYINYVIKLRYYIKKEGKKVQRGIYYLFITKLISV